MGYLNCPGCGRRLRVPDSLPLMEIQCPACRHTFRGDGVALEDDAAHPAADPKLAEPPAAEDPAGRAASIPNPHAAAGRILSKADEAMLRDYGSGSGLLELTREAVGLSAGGAPSPQAAPAAAGHSGGESDRQFQIVGTALTLANKLVLAHKTELARTRRQAALGWSLLAAMTLAAAAAGWWAVRQSGLTELERANVSLERLNVTNLSDRLLDANGQIADHRAREPRLAEEIAATRKDHRASQAELAAERNDHRATRGELSAARNEYRALQEDLADAREALGERRGAAATLMGLLDAANARIAALAAEVQRLQAELDAARAAEAERSTTQPASAPARPPSDADEVQITPAR